MYKVASILTLLIVVFSSKTLAQTGPGGVGTTDGTSNLVLWLNPDKGMNSNTFFEDQSGNNFDFTDGAGALVNANNVNGYNSYNFNGTNQYFEKSFETDLNPNEFSVFSVSKVTGSSAYKAVVSNRNQTNSAGSRSGFILYARPGNNNWDFWTVNDNSWATLGNTESTAGNWSVQNMYYKNETNGKRLFINNNLNETSTQGMLLNTQSPFRIGTGRNEGSPDYYFKGEIGEVIMFNSVLNEAQRIIVNNYLAAKYNIAITEDYYVQDDIANGNFDHNVAGIGKVGNNNKHLDSQGTGIIRIRKSGLANNKFLFWGENNKNATYSFTSISTTDCYDYIDTMWRISEPVGIGNNLRMHIKKSDLNLPTTNEYKKLELVVADNPNFTNATVYELEETATEFVYDIDGLGFNDGDYFTLRHINQIVWDGVNNFYNGDGVNNAPNENDACYQLEIKSGSTALLTENAHVKAIKINAGAVLEVEDGIELTIENGIHNEGTIKLLGEAQLIQKHTGTDSNTGTGAFTVRQKGSSNLYNYNYWSSPVHDSTGSWKVSNLQYFDEADNSLKTFAFNYGVNADPTTSPKTMSSRWLYTFNGEDGNYYAWQYAGTNTGILPGIGYTMKGSGASTTEQEYVFEGKNNNGDYSYPIAVGDEFLVGNPYPSALDADAFIADNLQSTTGVLYFYEQFETNNTHVTANYQGGYATYNLTMGTGAAAENANGGSQSKGAPTKNIAVGQGFFVKADDNGGQVVFNNSQRTFAKKSTNETVFFKTNGATQNITTTDTRTKFWLTFTDPDQRVREIGLGYDDNATVDYEKGYDAFDYDLFPDHMLWNVQDNKLVIQGRNNFNIDNEMPLAIKISTAGSYTIGLKGTLNFPDATPIYLKDNVSGLYYNLRNENATLYFETGEYNNQYSIVYQDDETLSTDEIDSNTGLLVLYDTNNNQLEIKGYANLQDVKLLKVYNVVGQEIVSLKTVESPIVRLPNVSNGVYILELIDVNNGKVSKKFVKQ